MICYIRLGCGAQRTVRSDYFSFDCGAVSTSRDAATGALVPNEETCKAGLRADNKFYRIGTGFAGALRASFASTIAPTQSLSCLCLVAAVRSRIHHPSNSY